MGARVLVVVGSIAVFTLAIVAFVATKKREACDDCGESGRNPFFIPVQVDLARSVLDDKDYRGAIR